MKGEHVQDPTEITTEFMKNKIDKNGSKFQPVPYFQTHPFITQSVLFILKYDQNWSKMPMAGLSSPTGASLDGW